MAIFRVPEIPNEVGVLDDEAFPDGAPVSAHILRELIRNSNRHVSKGHMMLQWVGRYDGVASFATNGTATSYAKPDWRYLIPPANWAVPKKFGLTKARAKIRAWITSGYKVQVFFQTSEYPDPSSAPPSQFLLMTGVGSVDAYTTSGIVVRPGEAELLGVMYRAIINVATDAILDTATYGGDNSAVAVYDNGGIRDLVLINGWLSASGTSTRMHLGGYYCYCTDANGAFVLQPSYISNVGQTEIVLLGIERTFVFYVDAPRDAVEKVTGSTYNIRKLPAVSLVSCAVYAQDSNAEDYGFR